MSEAESGSRGKEWWQRARASLARAGEKSAGGLRRTREAVSDAVGQAAERIRESEAGERLKASLDTQRVMKRASDAQARGNAPMAFRLLAEELRAKPDDERLVLAFWNVAASQGRGAEAAELVTSLLRRRISRGELEAAAGLWIELVAAVPGVRLDAGPLVRMLPTLEALDRASAVAALGRVLDAETPGLTPGLAVRAAELGRSLDPPAAARAARVALASPEIDASRREKLEALVHELEVAEAGDADESVAAAAAPAEKLAPPSPASSPVAPPAPEPGSRQEVANVEPVQAPPVEPLAHEEAPTSPPQAPAPAEPDGPAPIDPPPAPPPAEEDEPVAIDAPQAPLLVEEDTPAAIDAPQAPLLVEEDTPAAIDAPQAPLLAEEDELAAIDAPQAPLLAEEDEPAVIDAPQAPPYAPEEPPAVDPDFCELEIEETIEEVDPPVRFAGLKVMHAAPLGLTEHGVRLSVDGGRKAMLAYDKIQAMAVCEVMLPEGPSVWIDLALNWYGADQAPLRLVRLRGDQFEPDDLANEITGPQTLRGFLAQLLTRSNALPLPDVNGAVGDPLHVIDDEATYLRQVLLVGKVSD